MGWIYENTLGRIVNYFKSEPEQILSREEEIARADNAVAEALDEYTHHQKGPESSFNRLIDSIDKATSDLENRTLDDSSEGRE